MSEIWWKELRERDPAQWERLTERKDARNNCALMAIFIDREGGKDINVYEDPHTGQGCVVQFVKGDPKKYGDWEYVDINISDSKPDAVNVGLGIPSVLEPQKTDELFALGCEPHHKHVGMPEFHPPGLVIMDNCPIKDVTQMKALAKALIK